MEGRRGCDVHMELLDFYFLIYIIVDVGFSYSSPFCCCVSGMMIFFIPKFIVQNHVLNCIFIKYGVRLLYYI